MKLVILFMMLAPFPLMTIMMMVMITNNIMMMKKMIRDGTWPCSIPTSPALSLAACLTSTT